MRRPGYFTTTSPLIALAKLDKLDLLAQIFRKILIPKKQRIFIECSSNRHIINQLLFQNAG